MSDLSRRGFLRAVPAAGAAAIVGAACRRAVPYRESDFSVPDRSPVALIPAATYEEDLGALISRGLAEFDLPVRGRRVLLKPNLVEYEAGTAINTHAAVVAGAAEAFLRAGAREVVVGEGPGHRRDTEYLVTSTGLFERLRELKVPFVDLNHDDVRVVPTRSWFTELKEIALPVSVLAADLVVSLPKLKTHHWAGMTCGMKNFFGVVPGAVYGWPKNLLHFRGIENSIVDLVATVKPAFAIVDAIVAMEGDGPIMGTPRAMGFLAMGADPVAVDATCARVIGLAPERVPYLAMGGEYLGNLPAGRIEQRGERVERYATGFQILPHLEGLRAAAE